MRGFYALRFRRRDGSGLILGAAEGRVSKDGCTVWTLAAILRDARKCALLGMRSEMIASCGGGKTSVAAFCHRA